MIAVVISDGGHASIDDVLQWPLQKALEMNARIQLIHQKRADAFEKAKRKNRR